MKQEKIREKQLAEQREARRQKNVLRKEKRVNKKLEQMGVIPKAEPKEQPVGKKEEAAKEGKKSPEKKKDQQPAKKQEEKKAPAKEQPKQEKQ